MPKYKVSLCYSGYLDVEIECDRENDALIAAAAAVPDVGRSRILDALERWEDADMVEKQ